MGHGTWAILQYEYESSESVCDLSLRCIWECQTPRLEHTLALSIVAGIGIARIRLFGQVHMPHDGCKQQTDDRRGNHVACHGP
eukprot:11339761-Alexandrium_andersonii.AAC.1